VRRQMKFWENLEKNLDNAEGVAYNIVLNKILEN
jgi:hypothetical protein